MAVLLALVVAALEGTVVTTAMPTITADLGGRDLYGWVFSAFLVANAVSVLVCGKLADGLGRKPTFVLGSALFLAGSLLSASARSVPWLIAFRALQGLGAGGIQPVAMTITTDLYTLRERARIQGLLTAVWGGANVLGPIAGGAIVARASWRWVFLAPAPFALLSVLVLMAAYTDVPREGPKTAGLGGAALGGLTVSLALLGLEPRFAYRPLAAVVACLCGVVLAVTQSRAHAPIVPKRVLVDPVVRAGLVGGAFAGGVLYLSLAFVPLWMIERAGQDAHLAGVPLICLLGGWALGSTFGVRIFIAKGMRWSSGGGYFLACLAAIAMMLAARVGATVPVLIALFVLGLGLGPAASTALVAPQNHVEPHLRGIVTSSCYASRMLGGSVTIALAGALAPQGGAVSFTFGGLIVLSGVGFLAMIVLSPAVRPHAPAGPG
ncbi:MAG: MFS transporter [Polyangiaceae bacterium]